jgi:hypothetical protein
MAAARLEGLRSPRPEAVKLVGGFGFSGPDATTGGVAAATAGFSPARAAAARC